MTTKTFAAAAILAGVSAVGSSTTMQGADWPSFRGPAHDGKSVETISWPQAGPRPRWKIIVGIGHSAMSVVGDRAYTMGNANDTDTVFRDRRRHRTDRLEAFVSVQREGRHQGLRRSVRHTDRRERRRLYAQSQGGRLRPGRQNRQGDLGARHREEDVILNGSPGGMALDLKTGKTLWKSGKGPGGHATPVALQIGRKTHLAIHSPRALTIVDAADGREVWTTERRQPIGVNAPDPVVDGTKVFVTAGRAFGGALFDVTGAVAPL